MGISIYRGISQRRSATSSDGGSAFRIYVVSHNLNDSLRRPSFWIASNHFPDSNGKTTLAAIAMTTIEAASPPIGSEIFFVIALLVISLVVLLLERYYLPLRTTPAYLLVPIFFALWLPASIILLVPIDIASSSSDHDAGSRGIWLPRRLLLVSWRISYWLTFVLTWYACPSDV